MKMVTLMKMLLLAAVGVSLLGCATSGTDALSGASARQGGGWQLTVAGEHTIRFTEEDYEELSSQAEQISLSRRGTEYVYEGVPLIHILALVDGGGDTQFDEELWKEGYDITLTAADGYSVTFNTNEISYEDIYISTLENGQAVSPRIVGKDLSSKYQVESLERIECDLGIQQADDAFTLTVEVNDQQMSFTRAELEQSPYYVEGSGGYTTSAGTYYEHRYGGVAAADFLSSFLSLTEDSTVTVTAADGYEMSYSGEDLLDTRDGLWIFAFRQDGEYLPLDPGYVRTIQISQGGEVPNIDGHSSARMVEKISVAGEPLREFTLRISGKTDSVLDRATVQSGINCSAHKKSVTYYNKKTGEEEVYTGIPLYLLLAYGDDKQYKPHKQTDKSILSYDKEAALSGYDVRITASDGYAVTLDSRELHANEDVILAMYQEGEELSGDNWPLKLVWDKDAERVPEGVKAVRAVEHIELIF
ncbi:MAG: hypothetical protein ACQEQU_07985 [Spirochaetota bacterium]